MPAMIVALVVKVTSPTSTSVAKASPCSSSMTLMLEQALGFWAYSSVTPEVTFLLVLGVLLSCFLGVLRGDPGATATAVAAAAAKAKNQPGQEDLDLDGCEEAFVKLVKDLVLSLERYWRL